MSQQISLFNPALQRQKACFSVATMGRGLAAGIAAIALLYGYLHHQAGALAEEARNTAKALQAEQAELARLASEHAARRKNAQLENELGALQAQLKEHEENLAVLQSGALGRTAGFSEHLRALARQSVNGLWLTGFSISGSGDLELRGRVLQPELVPGYIRQLGREKVLQGHAFAALRMSLPSAAGKTAPGYLEFNLASAEASAAAPATAAGRGGAS